MPTLKQYEKNFAPHDVPDAFAKLLAFDTKLASGYLSSGFELSVDLRGGIATWSNDPKFMACLFPFGNANGSGSIYAFWVPKGKDLASAPVVVFGDEGGVHVVAEDLPSLLRILTFDAEPMIDLDEVVYYKSDDDEPSDSAAAYAAWLKKTWKLAPANEKEVAGLVKAAKKKYGKPFATWLKQYYKG